MNATGPESGHPEDPLEERGRRSRERPLRIVALVVVVAVVLAIVLARFGGHPSRGLLPRAAGRAGHLAWRLARSRCETQGIRVAREFGSTDAVVGAYPTTVRLALSWPPPPPANVDSFSAVQPAYLCLIEGTFTAPFTCPSDDQSCRHPNETDLIVWLGVPTGPLESVRANFPTTPIQVAGS